MRSLIAGLVLGTVLLLSNGVRADSVTFSGSGTAGAFSGSASYDPGSLTIHLANSTSSVQNITAFFFNSVDNSLGVSLTSPTTFHDVTGVVASPYGMYEHGALANSDQTGIASGATETFNFTVSGTNASSVGVMNFFGEGGIGAEIGGEPLVAQFSDGGVVPDTVGPVPLPTTATCGLSLLAAMGFGRRSLRRRTA